jgi:hypothetical protein
VFVGMSVIAVMMGVFVGVLFTRKRGCRAQAQRKGQHGRNEGFVAKACHGRRILRMQLYGIHQRISLAAAYGVSRHGSDGCCGGPRPGALNGKGSLSRPAGRPQGSAAPLLVWHGGPRPDMPTASDPERTLTNRWCQYTYMPSFFLQQISMRPPVSTLVFWARAVNLLRE